MSNIHSFTGKYDFLSNFYEEADLVTYQGIGYKSVEAAFQAAKTDDLSVRLDIAAAASPGEAKRLGRRVNLRADWEEVKDTVMLHLLRKKFRPYSGLAEKLLETGDVVLVEDTYWHDQYWGVCTCSRHNGAGCNVLGQLLMHVRSELTTHGIKPLVISHDFRGDWL